MSFWICVNIEIWSLSSGMTWGKQSEWVTTQTREEGLQSDNFFLNSRIFLLNLRNFFTKLKDFLAKLKVLENPVTFVAAKWLKKPGCYLCCIWIERFQIARERWLQTNMQMMTATICARHLLICISPNSLRLKYCSCLSKCHINYPHTSWNLPY